jgi:hypothetical protein
LGWQSGSQAAYYENSAHLPSEKYAKPQWQEIVAALNLRP